MTERPRVADDRPAHAEGLDGPEGRRRPPGRGHLALPPGPAVGPARQPRAPRAARSVDALATGPRSCSTDERRARGPSLPRSRPTGERRMSANPHANGGLLLRDLELPDFRELRRRRAGARRRRPARPRACSARWLRDVIAANGRQLPHHGARRDGVQPAERRLRGHRPRLERGAPRRRRPPRARRARHGGAERAPVPGLAGGLPADRPPRAVQLLRGVHPHRRLDVQPARQVAEGHARHPVAAARSPR